MKILGIPHRLCPISKHYETGYTCLGCQYGRHYSYYNDDFVDCIYKTSKHPWKFEKVTNDA